jgi:hypothetical protein
MKKSAVALAALIALVTPVAASAQISLGARAGTTGLGGEVSFGITRFIAVRGGIGFVPYEYEDDFEGVGYTINFPERIWNVGVDLYPLGNGLRVSAGVLNRPNFKLVAAGAQQAQIGNQTYDADLNILGVLENEKETAPYATIGFGRATGRGLGFFIDAGAAFVGDAEIQLSGSCRLRSNNADCPNFAAELQREEDEANTELEEFSSFVKLHPILNIGIRIGM